MYILRKQLLIKNMKYKIYITISIIKQKYLLATALTLVDFLK